MITRKRQKKRWKRVSNDFNERTRRYVVYCLYYSHRGTDEVYYGNDNGNGEVFTAQKMSKDRAFKTIRNLNYPEVNTLSIHFSEWRVGRVKI